MKLLMLISALLFVTLIGTAQVGHGLEGVRNAFQGVEDREDLQRILALDLSSMEQGDRNVLLAYQGAASCMMANYVFSPLSKLGYFKEGRVLIEQSISSERNAENVYLRMLIQLHVPKLLNYHEDIREDLDYLQRNLPDFAASVSFKETMIANLSVAAKKDEIRNALLQIPISE